MHPLWRRVSNLLGFLLGSDLLVPIYIVLGAAGLLTIIAADRMKIAALIPIGWCLLAPFALWLVIVFGIVWPWDNIRGLLQERRKRHVVRRKRPDA